jgi:hypothetical protein
MSHTTRLYFEAHITVKPFENADWEKFAEQARLNDCRASRFDVDEVDHYDGAWFLSARAKDYDALLNLISGAKSALVAEGYEFIRAKIEDTLFDTKHGDVL